MKSLVDNCYRWKTLLPASRFPRRSRDAGKIKQHDAARRCLSAARLLFLSFPISPSRLSLFQNFARGLKKRKINIILQYIYICIYTHTNTVLSYNVHRHNATKMRFLLIIRRFIVIFSTNSGIIFLLQLFYEGIKPF